MRNTVDLKLLFITIILTAFGLLMVLDSSANFATGIFGKYHYFVLQIVWILLGSIAGYLVYKIDYHRLLKYSPLILTIIVILLVVVLIKGQTINGAKRWINLGLFNLQPSEGAKIAIVLYLSGLLSKHTEKLKNSHDNLKHRIKVHLIPFMIVIGLVSGLIIIGKDLGTGEILIGTSIAIFFLAGTDFLHTLETIILIVGAIILGILAIVFQPYRVGRLLTFANYNADIQNQGYQLHQILIALSQGGWLGLGFTNSIQKTQYLVESTASTDSIFVVIAQEWGYVGAILLCLAFGYLFYRGFRIAFKAPDKQGQLLAAGIISWLFIQFFLNIGANIVLVPLTGVPLPFISYGGSAIISVLIGIAILLNISRQINTTD